MDHRRDHVRVLEVEVVARPVEVGHHRGARIEVVLAAIRVAEDEQHLLGQPVGRVRLLRVAVPDVLLLERDRCELRIGADRAGRDQLLRAQLPAGLEDVQPHRQVVVGERTRVAAVVADAPHVGGEMDDHLGPLQRVEAGGAVAQVVIGRANRPHLGAELLEQGDRGRAEEAGATGDRDGLAGPEAWIWLRGGHGRRLASAPGTDRAQPPRDAMPERRSWTPEQARGGASASSSRLTSGGCSSGKRNPLERTARDPERVRRRIGRIRPRSRCWRSGSDSG